MVISDGSRSSAWIKQSQLSPRDRQVVELVARFRQMTARQIHALLFVDLASKTPVDRSLKRLCGRGYLSRLAVRSIGGVGGGSSQYVYQIGRGGWRLLNLSGKYWAYRAVNHHVLELGELYVQLRVTERCGDLALIRFDREQEAWRQIGETQLTPDAYIELGNRTSRTKVTYFIELDRGTENTKQLKEKCVRYWRAYQAWDEQIFPFVMFTVPDASRRDELTNLLSTAPGSARALFRICVQSEIADLVAPTARTT